MDAPVGFQPTSNSCAYFVFILLGCHASIITSDSLLTTLSLPAFVFRFSIPEISIFCMGSAMAQAVILRPFVAEVQVHSHASPCGIFGGRYGLAMGVSPSTCALSR